MSNNRDPNFGFVGGANGFEEWACDDFNLLEYVGHDNAPFDLGKTNNDSFDLNDEDDSLQKKDMLYSTLQYNNALLNNDQSTDHFSDVPFFDPHNRMQSLPEDSGYIVSENPLLPSTSKATSATQRLIKIEVDHPAEYYEDQFSCHNSVKSDNSSKPYTPKIKPRKYRVKPDSEKRNPQYRAKREKNNDAVRRSRDKAKRVQEQKEDRLYYLEEDNIRKSKLVDQLRTRNDFLEKQLITLKRNCTCCITNR